MLKVCWYSYSIKNNLSVFIQILYRKVKIIENGKTFILIWNMLVSYNYSMTLRVPTDLASMYNMPLKNLLSLRLFFFKFSYSREYYISPIFSHPTDNTDTQAWLICIQCRPKMLIFVSHPALQNKQASLTSKNNIEAWP